MNVLRNILAGSRYLIIISVIGTLIGSIIVLGYGAITVVGVLINVFFNHNVFTTEEVKVVAASSVELIQSCLYLTGWKFGDYSIVALGIAVGLVLFAIGYSLTAGALQSKLTQSNERNDENHVVDNQQ